MQKVIHQFIHTLFCIAIAFQSSVILADAPADGQKSNVILILVDDLAEADLGYFGNPYHDTPNVNRLFKEGLHFTNAYASAPICSASRAALLTGKTTARLHFEFVTKNNNGKQEMKTRLQSPDYPTNLKLEEKTIPEYLSEAGYSTAFFGKWHLNQYYKRYLGWSPKFGPQKQGFQTTLEDFGSHPYSYFNKKKKRGFQPIADGKFPADSVTAHAIDYLENQKDKEKPFFLMLSHFYVHTPVHTRSQWLYKKYNKKLPQNIPNRIKRIQYAAFAETMDHYVGQVLTAIDDCRLTKSTLVIFTSDNGGHPEYSTNSPYRGSKWNLYEGGIRVPLVMRWPDKISSGEKTNIPVVGYDLLPSICAAVGIQKTASEVDGENIFELLENAKRATSREIIWHFPYTIRKLVTKVRKKQLVIRISKSRKRSHILRFE